MESGSRMNLSRPPHYELRSLGRHPLQSLLRWKVNCPGKQAIRIKRSHWRQLIKNSDRECRRMARLVGICFALASSDAGNWELHYTKTELDTLLIEAYEASSCFAGKKYKPSYWSFQRNRSCRFLPTGRDWSRLSRFSSTMPSPILRPERKYG